MKPAENEKIRNFVETEVREAAQFSYWSLFKNYDWVTSQVTDEAKNKKRFQILEQLTGPTLLYLQATSEKRKTRAIKNLYKEIAKAIQKLTKREVVLDLASDRPVRIDNVSMQIVGDQCNIFCHDAVVMRVTMRLVNIWEHLLPDMLHI